jgi:hypothetical protein
MRIDCDQGWPTGRLDLGLSPTADLRDGEVRWVSQPRLPVPSLAGDGFQVGQDQLAILVLGDITGGGQGPVGVLPGLDLVSGDRVGAGQGLVGEGEVEVPDAVLLAQVQDPAGVVQRGLGPAEDRPCPPWWQPPRVVE